MRFGKSFAERKAANLEKARIRYGVGLWFAWRPVQTDSGEMVWLEKVRRDYGFYETKSNYRGWKLLHPRPIYYIVYIFTEEANDAKS